MLTAPLPANEADRLRALRRLGILDTAPDPVFDALVASAARLCDVPISLISLVDDNRQWFKANAGLTGVTQTARDVAFCSHAILEEDLFVVEDAREDERFADNPLVRGQPNIRFYAGAPLRLSGGQQVGTLCVIDRHPRKLDDRQRETLRLLGVAATRALEAHRAMTEVTASERRFRALSASSPVGTYATDASGNCTYVNERWQEIFGLSEAQAIGSRWAANLHPEDLTEVFSTWHRQAALKQDFSMEFRIRQPDGTVRHVHSRARPIHDASGIVTDFVGTVEDITERLQTRRALEAESTRMAAILEGTSAGTWEWNVQTGETRFNHRWAEMIGRTPGELGSTTIQTWLDACHPEDLARSNELLQAHFSGRTKQYECEVRLRHRDGHWIWVLARGRVLTWTPDGLPEWMFGTHLDISSRKAQEEALRRSEALLSATGALAQVGGWEIDIQANRLTWSEQTCRIHGVEPGYQPTLKEAIEFYAPETRPTIEAAVSRAMVSGERWELELPFVQKGGRRIWVRAFGEAQFEGGRPVRLLGAFQDVTAQVIAHQARDAALARLELATHSGEIGVWEVQLSTGEVIWDSQMPRLYGLPPGSEALRPQAWMELVHPEDRDRVQGALRTALLTQPHLDLDFRVHWPDGSVHHLRSSARIGRDDAGRALQLVGVAWDITPMRELAARLAEQHEVLRVTLESIGDAVITTDVNGIVTWLNPVAERLTGWSSAEALGLPLDRVFRIINGENRQPAESPVRACVEQGTTTGLAKDTVLVSRSGREFGIEDSAAPIRHKNGDLLGVVLVFHDVTEQRRLSGEMTFRAQHDPLTGLVNRAEFETRLRRTLDRTREDRSNHVLLYIDLDQFKLVNDACGHSVGDQLLQQVAKMLRDSVRSRDTLARLGGDEFAVILEHCDATQATRVAQQICDRMEEFRFVHEGRRFRIGTSIGLVPLDARWLRLEAALQAADASCYAAKEAGRNRVHVWFDSDESVRVRHGDMQWATRLEQALDEDQFVLHAQRIDPLSSPASGLHIEVLLRMIDADGGLIMPAAYLPAAERFHLATRVDRWVLQQVLRQLQRLPRLTAVDTVCVNLSGQSVGDRAFHLQAIDLLRAAGPTICQRLCLEITETAAITNMVDAALFIENIHALGVRVALDDFGAGASSFGYLKTLRVDMLKIDGSFIRDLVDDPLDAAAVRCFVEVARVQGLKTVAEFVDNARVLERVRELGVDHAQGYLLHQPEALEEILNRAMASSPA